MTTSEIINLIASSIIILILFYQNSIIKKMKDFMTLFDIDKLKKSTEWIIKGESYKHIDEKKELKEEIDNISKEKNKIINELKNSYDKATKQSEKLLIANKISFLIQTIITAVLGQIHSAAFINTNYVAECQKENPKLLEDKVLNNLNNNSIHYNQKIFDRTLKLIEFVELIDSKPDEMIENMFSVKNEIVEIEKHVVRDEKILKTYGKTHNLDNS